MQDKEADIIGGLLLREFDHLPKRGESIEIQGYRFKSITCRQTTHPFIASYSKETQKIMRANQLPCTSTKKWLK